MECIHLISGCLLKSVEPVGTCCVRSAHLFRRCAFHIEVQDVQVQSEAIPDLEAGAQRCAKWTWRDVMIYDMIYSINFDNFLINEWSCPESLVAGMFQKQCKLERLCPSRLTYWLRFVYVCLFLLNLLWGWTVADWLVMGGRWPRVQSQAALPVEAGSANIARLCVTVVRHTSNDVTVDVQMCLLLSLNSMRRHRFFAPALLPICSNLAARIEKSK